MQKNKTKKMLKKKVFHSGKTWQFGIQTSAHRGGYLGSLYPACDIRAFHVVVVIVWGKELEQRDSWFDYHAH
jgi:hypothetical protein